ncbi:MAG: fibronectin type III domain-containing protein, partial [Planctomycetaceae bacterium]
VDIRRPMSVRSPACGGRFGEPGAGAGVRGAAEFCDAAFSEAAGWSVSAAGSGCSAALSLRAAAASASVTMVGPNIQAWSATGLVANTRYYFRVRAWNSGGNSAWSSIASIKTKP